VAAAGAAVGAGWQALIAANPAAIVALSFRKSRRFIFVLFFIIHLL
jgi:hypothetical protein